ncbi:vWA domain-containing protein [Oharaeibacter diazotrophicus]|uniref:VWFA domain-containing protein n=1 Tax=Oharaeibacter diazotrophicus TaxID=1920512 RepID=A0A4R6RB39_9HYPH|nr:vWA domain-containing protein [Oharaeibacter diazotrophicus]TDP83343.1 hypothetical protein EDD54_3305 [Oharaeibacter diazotrophicus]BBE72176.1 hypothetical protein OHA_1_01765 [Pleomorphomonas sp. SM30]GLS78942.1 hypothetical protein GCM10007904_42790 [Oharaeibacter diazotrophicus]
MTMFARTLLAATLLSAAPAVALAAPDGQQRPVERVEVAFVLDTTGSMADLIDGAKKKIWSIADEIRRTRPDADIRFALVGYRDRGDVYVTDVTALTGDLHGLYGRLVGYEADGGGDWPEAVNEALATAVNRLEWTDGGATRRMVFLVGDAPPHMDYIQDVAFTDTLKIAERRGIVVNAVQAGAAEDTEVAWRAIAALGKGDYVAIPQSGNVRVIETPYDQQIRELQLQLNLTVVPYGDRDQRGAVEDKLRLKAQAAPAAASDMASYEIRPTAPAARSVVTGGGDLVADVQSGEADLATVDRDALPEEVRDLAPAELEAAVKAKIAERERIQGEVADLVAKRDAFLSEAAAKAGPAEGDSFDGAIRQTIARQML